MAARSQATTLDAIIQSAGAGGAGRVVSRNVFLNAKGLRPELTDGDGDGNDITGEHFCWQAMESAFMRLE